MNMSEKLKNITKEDWRLLGYYYDRDDKDRKWIFKGSKYGLEEFCIYLEKYSGQIKNRNVGEHEHIGPYSYLTIMTSDTPAISKKYISGSLDDLKKLSKLLRGKIKDSKVNEILKIDEEYCLDCEYSLEFWIMDYGSDPAIEDKQLWDES